MKLIELLELFDNEEIIVGDYSESVKEWDLWAKRIGATEAKPLLEHGHAFDMIQALLEMIRAGGFEDYPQPATVDKAAILKHLDVKIETCKGSRSRYLQKGKLKEARYKNDAINICGELKYLIEECCSSGAKSESNMATSMIGLLTSIDGARGAISSSKHKTDWNYTQLDSALKEVKEIIIMQRLLVGFDE